MLKYGAIETSQIPGGNNIWHNHFGEQFAVSYQVKHALIMPSNHTYSKEKEKENNIYIYTHTQTFTHTHTHV